MQPGNQFSSGKSVDGDQQLALTTSAKSRSCSLRNQFSSSKSANGDQQLTLTNSARNKSGSQGINTTHASQSMEISRPKTSHGIQESDQLKQDCQRIPSAQFDELNHSTQATEPRNQFNSGKSADEAQQLT